MKSLIAFGILLFVSATAHPLTLTAYGAIVTCDYDEPTVDVSSAPLKDLRETVLIYDIGQGTATAKTVPATSLTGGGHITTDITLPVLAGQKVIASVYALAVSTHDLVSDKSNVATIMVDRLAPGTPKTLVVAAGNLYYSFREPALNEDGSPIDDLDHVDIYYNDNYSAAIRLLVTLPASSLVGGEARTSVFPLTAFIPKSTVRIYPRFYDKNGNYSAFPQAIGIKLP